MSPGRASHAESFWFFRSQRSVALASVLMLTLSPLSAQPQASQTRQERWATGELARQNLGRVAAAANRIVEVLQQDAGLLVELKRWVALEASDRGQIVDDAELTDAAIFSRLAQDVEFRSVATRLLQRYGHLMPQAGPGSDAAFERDSLAQERAARLKRAEAESEAALRRANEENELSSAASPSPATSRPQHRSRFAPPDPLETPATPPPASPHAPLSGRLQTASTSLAGAQIPVEYKGDVSAASEEHLAQALASAGWNDEALSNGNGHAGLRRPAPQPSSVPSPPQMVRRPNPYAHVPSLYDLYLQAPQQPSQLERFGLEVFRNSSLTPDLLPMDLPVGPDYVVGPGDRLAIDVWGGVSQRLLRTVDSEGRVALPEVGPLLVSGQTMGEVQRSVQQTLRSQFRDISADVSLARLRSVRVYVAGDVEKPGAYEVSSLATPLAALFQAGGPSRSGSARTVRHLRGKTLVQEVDVYDLLLRGVRGDVRQLRDGDTVMVPPIGPQVKVEGMVRRPAIYELRSETPLDEVLELAGGILPIATLRSIQVQRLNAHEKRTMISLDLPAAGDSEAAREQLQAFRVRDGDEIRIYPIAQHNLDAVYLVGHALRPGRYSYRPGMRAGDLIGSYKDLLPEPAPKYAEIIRLHSPDFRPSVESFDLAAALADPAHSPALQPMDTVRIFSRYDFEEPPTVWVSGEVHQPGNYRTAGPLRIRDAVHLAGGTTPDARVDSAQVFRTLSGGELRVFSVNLAEALRGNPIENVLLQSRDRLLIHRSPAKVDPPTVRIQGEVAKPGRYPLTVNMRIADLIQVAGGLKRSAYAETADLTRYLPNQNAQTSGEHHEIQLGAALAGEGGSNLALRDGDTLTIRQIPGWKDIGATMVVEGEVRHPGTYGISPGERLSSVLQRAGGFLPTAYPRGAIYVRGEIRNLQERVRQELIQRVEQEGLNITVSLHESAQDQAALQHAAAAQKERVLAALRAAPATGRMVIRLSRDLSRFAGSPDDIEVRAGDSILVPRNPNVVMVTGQVYNPNALTYRPRKNANWYLERAGGATDLAQKKDIFIVRANGEVESGNSGDWWGSGVLSAKIEPGDTIVVPEKPISGSTFWKNFLAIAQVAGSAALSYAVATR